MKKKLSKFEILDHRVEAKKISTPYISQECVRNPDGSLKRDKHGMPEMRQIREMRDRISYKIKLTVDVDDSVIEFCSIPELCQIGGRKQVARELRRYKQLLKAAQQSDSSSTEGA